MLVSSETKWLEVLATKLLQNTAELRETEQEWRPTQLIDLEQLFQAVMPAAVSLCKPIDTQMKLAKNMLNAKENILDALMQDLIDQTIKREIADWLLQKSLPIIFCNSIIPASEFSCSKPVAAVNSGFIRSLYYWMHSAHR